MDNIIVLFLTGCLIGSIGTLIGAGGGFILVPLLLIMHPGMQPDIVTSISMALVATNAISGSTAYARSGRIDYKAGLLFAACTAPGSILGVVATQYIPKEAFHLVFGILLLLLAIFLFFRKPKRGEEKQALLKDERLYLQQLTDRQGNHYSYSYSRKKGIIISIFVGFFSPLLGIGGGIIHVPAMVQLLHFPVYIATATSHFILAIMTSISVVVHAIAGDYNNVKVLKVTLALCAGAIPGAQIGAVLSHNLKGNTIERALAVCLGIVGIRILLTV